MSYGYGAAERLHTVSVRLKKSELEKLEKAVSAEQSRRRKQRETNGYYWGHAQLSKSDVIRDALELYYSQAKLVEVPKAKKKAPARRRAVGAGK